MHYSTCFGCARDKASCQRRQRIRDAVSGLRVSSIKFACPEREPHFQPGQRVVVSLPYWEQDGPWEADCLIERFKGTVIRERKKPGSYKVKLDDGPGLTGESGYTMPADSKTGTGYVAVRAQHLEAIDEPARAVCNFCENTGGAHEWHCSLRAINGGEP